MLHFPDYGYRVWKEPGTGAVVEELLAGPSVTKARRFTRGEDVLFSAADMGEAYRAAGTERAHGAGSPGLGFDAPYGVAHAVRRINQWLENRGVEQWVRNLRDNAEPGVEYLWTTRTKKAGQSLAQREYTISAVVEGQIYELYVFETSVPAGSARQRHRCQVRSGRCVTGRRGVRRTADQAEPCGAGGRRRGRQQRPAPDPRSNGWNRLRSSSTPSTGRGARRRSSRTRRWCGPASGSRP